ncbi:MAG: Gfo/Idh/MocA family oxidoreductase [Ruminococcaceae bacterium]|nr:Gfo/Idh/MocA family oxidoreductase [Oscillospiraceae bacterium]
MQRKIRLAIVGTGSIARSHMQGIQRLDEAELAAVCDVHQSQLDWFTNLYPVPKENCYTDLDAMLARDDIDGVIVCTPDFSHCDVSVRAMRAGKDVLCEKPMALDLEECREMVRVSEETGRRLMIGQVCRKAPGFIKAKELIDSGVIGELFFVESEYAHDYMHSTGVDKWRMTPERHPIIGGGCHAVDLLRWLAGDPTEVTAYANHKMLPDWPIDDCVVAIMKFPNDVIGKVFTSIGCKRKYTMRTVIYGSEGTIICDNTSSEIFLYRSNAKEESEGLKITQGMELKIPVAIDSHNMTAEIKDFCEAILNNTPASPDGRQGLGTVAVCDAIVRSSKSGEKAFPAYEV